MSDLSGFALSAWSETDALKALRDEAALPLSERLTREADRESRRGDQYKGCTWTGFEHPSAHHYRSASLLRQAALLALRDEQRKAKRAKLKERG